MRLPAPLIVALLLSLAGCSTTATPGPAPNSPAATTTTPAGLVYEVYGDAPQAAFIEVHNGTETFFIDYVPLPWTFPARDTVDDVAIFTARADTYGTLTCRVSRNGRVLATDTVVFGPSDVTIPFAHCGL